MRLISTGTLDMREFLPTYIPRYAILSHRWQEEEVSFKQYSKRHKYPEIQRLKGFAKIEQLCRIARERQMEWAWIDTCCIDSRSSAELSEAINSMWRWYKNANECYIYLCDVHMQDDFSKVLAQVEGSEWFTRGWTLQELIAPRYRVFFTSRWAEIGSIKSKPGFAYEEIGEDPSCVEGSSLRFPRFISRTSKIPLSCLLGRGEGLFSIGERISWAADRRTSRPEDMAYSLIGLLKVNMPLLYGEGEEKSFIRLQSEVIKKSNDTSLFAWKFMTDVHYIGGGDLLSSSPACFAGFDGDRKRHDSFWSFAPFYAEVTRAPCVMTNQGLYIRVGAYQVQGIAAYNGSALWCIPLSRHGSAIFLEHDRGSDPRISPVPASRTALHACFFTHNGKLILKGARTPICRMKNLDPSKCLIHLTKGQIGRLELCEFYVRQSCV